MEVINLEDDSAEQWFAEQAAPEAPVRSARTHVVIGDSIAKRSNLRSGVAGDSTCNRAHGGATWRSVERHLEADIGIWQLAAAANGDSLGSALVWVNGNELYTRYTQMSAFEASDLCDVGVLATRVVKRLLEFAEAVYLVGPLPRPAGELLGTPWQITAAFHHERTLMKLELGERCRCLPVGRSLVRRMGRRERGIWGIEEFFVDGVHPSPSGYARIAASAHFPEWLKVGE